MSLKEVAFFLAGGGVQVWVLPRGIFSISGRLFFYLFWCGKSTVLHHMVKGLGIGRGFSAVRWEFSVLTER